MTYDELSKQRDYILACREYLAEVYGEAVVHQFPAVQDTLWNSILSGATEELAQLHILSDHRLPPPENK